jgi:hypothetical protein
MTSFFARRRPAYFKDPEKEGALQMPGNALVANKWIRLIAYISRRERNRTLGPVPIDPQAVYPLKIQIYRSMLLG